MPSKVVEQQVFVLCVTGFATESQTLNPLWPLQRSTETPPAECNPIIGQKSQPKISDFPLLKGIFGSVGGRLNASKIVRARAVV